jgi:hypothetical protein
MSDEKRSSYVLLSIALFLKKESGEIVWFGLGIEIESGYDAKIV